MEKTTAKERVVIEKNELAERLLKLENFMQTEKFNDLPYAQAYLLNRQSKLMARYIDVLDARLSIMEE